MHRLLHRLAKFAAVVSSGFTLLAIVLLFTAEDHSVGTTMLAFFGVAAAASVALARWSGRADRDSRTTRREQIVLEIAARSGGRITVAELAAHPELTADEARETLEALGRSGVTRVDFDDNGEVVYRVDGLASRTTRSLEG